MRDDRLADKKEDMNRKMEIIQVFRNLYGIKMDYNLRDLQNISDVELYIKFRRIQID